MKWQKIESVWNGNVNPQNLMILPDRQRECDYFEQLWMTPSEFLLENRIKIVEYFYYEFVFNQIPKHHLQISFSSDRLH